MIREEKVYEINPKHKEEYMKRTRHVRDMWLDIGCLLNKNVLNHDRKLDIGIFVRVRITEVRGTIIWKGLIGG